MLMSRGRSRVEDRRLLARDPCSRVEIGPSRGTVEPSRAHFRSCLPLSGLGAVTPISTIGSYIPRQILDRYVRLEPTQPEINALQAPGLLLASP